MHCQRLKLGRTLLKIRVILGGVDHCEQEHATTSASTIIGSPTVAVEERVRNLEKKAAAVDDAKLVLKKAKAAAKLAVKEANAAENLAEKGRKAAAVKAALIEKKLTNENAAAINEKRCLQKKLAEREIEALGLLSGLAEERKNFATKEEALNGELLYEKKRCLSLEEKSKVDKLLIKRLRSQSNYYRKQSHALLPEKLWVPLPLLPARMGGTNGKGTSIFAFKYAKRWYWKWC